MQMHHTIKGLDHATGNGVRAAIDASTEVYISAAMVRVAALAMSVATGDDVQSKSVQVVAFEAASRLDGVLEMEEADRVADLGFVDVFSDYMDARRAYRQAASQGLDDQAIEERLWSAERRVITYPCRTRQRTEHKIKEVLQDKDLFQAVCDGREGQLVRDLLSSMIAEA